MKLSRIPALSDSAQDADESGDDQVQGAHSLAAQTTVLLAPNDVSGELDPTSTAQAIARKSAFAAELQRRGRRGPRRPAPARAQARARQRARLAALGQLPRPARPPHRHRSSATASRSRSSATRSA